jgi:hypothetical protein
LKLVSSTKIISFPDSRGGMSRGLPGTMSDPDVADFESKSATASGEEGQICMEFILITTRAPVSLLASRRLPAHSKVYWQAGVSAVI